MFKISRDSDISNNRKGIWYIAVIVDIKVWELVAFTYQN